MRFLHVFCFLFFFFVTSIFACRKSAFPVLYRITPPSPPYPPCCPIPFAGFNGCLNTTAQKPFFFKLCKDVEPLLEYSMPACSTFCAPLRKHSSMQYKDHILCVRLPAQCSGGFCWGSVGRATPFRCYAWGATIRGIGNSTKYLHLVHRILRSSCWRRIYFFWYFMCCLFGCLLVWVCFVFYRSIALPSVTHFSGLPSKRQ